MSCDLKTVIGGVGAGLQMLAIYFWLVDFFCLLSIYHFLCFQDLYMFGMEKLKGAFDENYELMLEKEIRIKLIIEELDLLIED